MNILENVCHGCLCGDRKMHPLVNQLKRLCFFNLLNEIPLTKADTVQVLLCWECEALVNKFVKFQKLLQEAHKTLNNFLILGLSGKIPYEPHLKLEIINNISYPPITEEQVAVKEESDVELDIKEEPHEINNSDPCSEDDRVLIEFTDRKRKLTNIQKRRKKKNLRAVEKYREVKLSLNDVQEERDMMEKRDDYVNAMFRCEKCIISFPNANDFKDHITNKHELNASKYVCKICQCSFGNEMSYKYHTNKHIVRYQCSMCGERYGSKRAVTNHYDTIHCHRPELDYNLEKKSPENRDHENGADTQNGTECEVASYPCDSCHKVFRWKTSLRKHAETHRIETGQKRRPFCEPCGLSFTTTSNLQKHVKTSSKHQIQLKLRKLQDTLPQELNPDKQAAHIEQIKTSIMSARQLHRCPQCDKSFQWRGNLLRHMHSHTARANGELVCSPCNRTFSSIATYKQHMKISKKHVSEDDFKYMCSECGKKFVDKTRLKDHIDWEHLKNYVHTCVFCQKVFKSHTSLYVHKQVVHKTNTADFLCDHCGKHFPNKAKLRCHITALHSGSQPYKCTSCPARFSWHSCLARHVRRGHRQ